MKLLSVIPQSIKIWVKRFSRNPFENHKKLIVHTCYHKVGTVWFSRILRSIASYYGLKFQKSTPDKLEKDTEIFFDDHSLIDPGLLINYVGSHMIRDPRDIVISGYFYHLRTSEKWALETKEEYGNMSYQELLKSKNRDDGIMLEIERTLPEINQMAKWDYSNPNFIEIKYEDIIKNESEYFKRIFQHYGFNKKAINKALEIANSFSIKNLKPKKNSHIRSGKPGEWKKFFTGEHKTYFKNRLGDALIILGYEKDYDW